MILLRATVTPCPIPPIANNLVITGAAFLILLTALAACAAFPKPGINDTASNPKPNPRFPTSPQSRPSLVTSAINPAPVPTTPRALGAKIDPKSAANAPSSQ